MASGKARKESTINGMLQAASEKPDEGATKAPLPKARAGEALPTTPIADDEQLTKTFVMQLFPELKNDISAFRADLQHGLS
ncbi:hypothetical protein NDU88_005163 [Pleurodeles waltl]|uniref:Uncharacterized protein n=1 Tax=Pleurodeles waltl TaxID=8319 RepID=A0AAV7ULA7_PLEWA|nr:hypothetical protein NDU88_005163 [Pleurodeles waltl]